MCAHEGERERAVTFVTIPFAHNCIAIHLNPTFTTIAQLRRWRRRRWRRRHHHQPHERSLVAFALGVVVAIAGTGAQLVAVVRVRWLEGNRFDSGSTPADDNSGSSTCSGLAAGSRKPMFERSRSWNRTFDYLSIGLD